MHTGDKERGGRQGRQRVEERGRGLGEGQRQGQGWSGGTLRGAQDVDSCRRPPVPPGAAALSVSGVDNKKAPERAAAAATWVKHRVGAVDGPLRASGDKKFTRFLDGRSLVVIPSGSAALGRLEGSQKLRDGLLLASIPLPATKR